MIESFTRAEWVKLNGRNFRAEHQCKKLEDKMLGPFEILSVGSYHRYCKLMSPAAWKMNSVFNIHLLERYKEMDPTKQVSEIQADRND